MLCSSPFGPRLGQLSDSVVAQPGREGGRQGGPSCAVQLSPTSGPVRRRIVDVVVSASGTTFN